MKRDELCARKRAIKAETKRISAAIPFTRGDAERLVKLELTVQDIRDHMKGLNLTARIVGITLLTALVGIIADLIAR